MFYPAYGHVEIEPIKQEGIIIDPSRKFEEMGRVIALPQHVVDRPYETNSAKISLGDIIYFDSYACRATPEIDGKKHYVVNVNDGGIIGIEKPDVETVPVQS